MGLGNLEEDLEQAEAFYQEVANLAKENGVSISVVSIKGEGCKLDILSNLAEMTAGTIKRVTPQDIGQDFASILKDEIVGTKIRLQVRIHKGLKFRNEQEGISPDGTILERNIGNATVKTQLTVEYTLKPEQELKQNDIDINTLKTVPFQAVIEYEAANGDKMLRVFSKMLETTKDKRASEQSSNFRILQHNITSKTVLFKIIFQARFVKSGQTREGTMYSQNWNDYVQKNVNFNNSEEVVQQKQ